MYLEHATDSDKKRRTHKRDKNWLAASPNREGQMSPQMEHQVVVSTRIYHPYTSTKLMYSQEVLMLASKHTLADLKDQIKCTADFKLPSQSAFFFINGVFYNDTRLESNVDLSEVLRDWAATTKRGFGPLKVVRKKHSYLWPLF